MFEPPSPETPVVPMGKGFYFEHRRAFIRKSITLALAILALAPILLWKSEVGALIYLVALVVIHIGALVVFINRVAWRDLFRHPMGIVTRVGGLIIFGGLLAMLNIDAQSQWFWAALTLLWLIHIAALALLHVRHVREFSDGRGCPVGPFSKDP